MVDYTESLAYFRLIRPVQGAPGRRIVPVFIALILLGGSVPFGQTIFTVAGGGPSNLPAVEANLAGPVGVGIDQEGNLFVAASNRVFKVDTSGSLTPVAGNGLTGFLAGFGGDGGSAIEPGLDGPLGVAVDGFGSLFIADSRNNRVRKVDSTGIITTVAGNGMGEFSGDGGLAVEAGMSNPTGVAVDSNGVLFIADLGSHRIRKVDPDGIISKVAGNGVAGFNGDGGSAVEASLWFPAGVAVDSSGVLFIADLLNHRIRRVDSDGIISTVAGNGFLEYSGDGGPVTDAGLNSVQGLALDSLGNLILADSENNRVRRVDSRGLINTVAGNGQIQFSGDGRRATSASLSNLLGVTAHEDHFLIADSDNHRIRRVGPDGTIMTVAGSGMFGFAGDGGPAKDADLYLPTSAVVDGSGTLFIADTLNHRIRMVKPGGIITTFAGNGLSDFGGDGGPATEASLVRPRSIALDQMGNVLIADYNRVRRVDYNGIITTVAGNGLTGSSGNGGPATQASLDAPSIAVDGDGRLYIADSRNLRIRRVDLDGKISTVAGNGLRGVSGDGGPAIAASLVSPASVAVDDAGDLLIADFNRIRKVGLTPQGLLLDLSISLRDLGLLHGIETSLVAKLDAAKAALNDSSRDDHSRASNVLKAFIRSIQAQRGKLIPEEDADGLIDVSRATSSSSRFRMTDPDRS